MELRSNHNKGDIEPWHWEHKSQLTSGKSRATFPGRRWSERRRGCILYSILYYYIHGTISWESLLRVVFFNQCFVGVFFYISPLVAEVSSHKPYWNSKHALHPSNLQTLHKALYSYSSCHRGTLTAFGIAAPVFTHKITALCQHHPISVLFQL